MGDTATILLTLVGIAVIVVGVLLLVQLRSGPAAVAAPAERVIVREVRGPRRLGRYPYWGRYPDRGTGPFYSHLPFRPLMY